MNPKVDAYFDKLDKWKNELQKLRALLLECSLTEELKWGSPCYSYHGNNVSIIGGLKDYAVLSFFKGSLLSDPDQLLEKPGENTQGGRVIKITSVQQINRMRSTLKTYVYEAIEIEKAGLKVDYKQKHELELPAEFQQTIDNDPALKKAFNALTPGRQRGYILFFSSAKQPATRLARIQKHVADILKGKGMND